MKNIFLIALFLFSSNFIFSQDGTYKNAANQVLTISNSDEAGFDFKISWGADDEWGCIFDADGKGTYSSNGAYYGEDEDMADILFTYKDGNIGIEGGMDFIGNDCARYGESMDGHYTLFKKVK